MSDESPGIRCPHCNCARHDVITTRKLPGGQIRRYRMCGSCHNQFVTKETAYVVAPKKKKPPKRVEPDPEFNFDDEDDLFGIIDEDDV